MRPDTVDLHGNEVRHCLHLGPAGERCTRPAYEDGFCDRHGASTAWPLSGQVSRKFAALLIGLAVIWPILEDLWHALRHWHR